MCDEAVLSDNKTMEIAINNTFIVLVKLWLATFNFRLIYLLSCTLTMNESHWAMLLIFQFTRMGKSSEVITISP